MSNWTLNSKLALGLLWNFLTLYRLCNSDTAIKNMGEGGAEVHNCPSHAEHRSLNPTSSLQPVCLFKKKNLYST